MKKLLPLLLLAAVLFTACHRAPKTETLKIMSFNIRNSSAWAEDGDNDWAHRREAVAQMILQVAPDALGMQEMLPDQLAYLDSALAGQYDRIGVGRDDGDTLGENMCIYYRRDRLALIHWDNRWLSETPDSVSFGWDAACRRTLTTAYFSVGDEGKRFFYLNTHLDHVGQEARKNSVLQLCQIIGHATDPVILGGDMNSSLADTIFAPLADIDMLAARDVADSSDDAMTFTGYGKCEATQIDHFFVRNLKVKTFETLNGDYGIPYLSDHYPILITVEL